MANFGRFGAPVASLVAISSLANMTVRGIERLPYPAGLQAHVICTSGSLLRFLGTNFYDFESRTLGFGIGNSDGWHLVSPSIGASGIYTFGADVPSAIGILVDSCPGHIHVALGR